VPMISGALIFLVNTVFDLFTVALLMRFFMQWARAPLRNALSEFLSALTDWMVRPARRLIPGLWGLDLATLVLAWVAQAVEFGIVLQIKGYQMGPQAGVAFAAIALMAAIVLVKLLIYIVMVV